MAFQLAGGAEHHLLETFKQSLDIVLLTCSIYQPCALAGTPVVSANDIRAGSHR
ncbi:MAG: hypothetical protein ACR5LF_11320 [Symbiopectobacterium sp.]